MDVQLGFTEKYPKFPALFLYRESTVKTLSVNGLSRNLDLTDKGKAHPRTGHEGPEEEKRYSSTLS